MSPRKQAPEQSFALMIVVNYEQKEKSMFKPVNRYIQVKVVEEPAMSTTTAGILLPNDYEPTEERYVQARILAWSPDVRFAEELSQDTTAIIDRSMVEEINSNGNRMYMILDNYVLGLITEQ